MPAGKTHFRDTGSDFCCLWLVVMEGVAKSHTLDARGTPRRVIVPSLSSHACRRYMRCTCRKDVSVDQKQGHLLPLVGPQHRPWPLGPATIAGATTPPMWNSPEACEPREQVSGVHNGTQPCVPP